MHSLFQDLRYGLRLLAKSPGFALVGVLTLALGIGANTAIFSVADAVLLHPLPYPHAGRLLSLQPIDAHGSHQGLTYAEFARLRDQASLLRRLSAYMVWPVTYRRTGNAHAALSAIVSPALFPLLGLRADQGRLFSAADANRAVVVVSHQFWQKHLHASAAAVGKTLSLGGSDFSLIGVLPAGARFPFLDGSPDIWIPLSRQEITGTLTPLFTGLHLNPLHIGILSAIGELTSGAGRAAAAAQARTLYTAYLRRYHPKQHRALTLEPLARVVGHGLRRAILLLFLAAGAMLLIAAVNLANLLLARITIRRPEIATRHALGASRAQLARQLFVENLALTLPGAGLGLAVAWALLAAFHPLLQPSLFQFHVVVFNRDVLGFSMLAALATALLIGLLPVWQFGAWTSPAALQQSATGGRSAGESRPVRRARQGLVVAEVALALLLLTGAGVLVRSLFAVLAVRPGFNPRHLLLSQLQLPAAQYPSPQSWQQFVNATLDRLRTQPGVVAAAAAISPPMAHMRISLSSSYQTPGHAKAASPVRLRPVSPGYFAALQIPLLAGRDFNRGDGAGAGRVCIANQKMAAQAFPGENALGRHLMLSKKLMPGGCRIVGLAGDTIESALNVPPRPAVYVPYAQLSLPYIGFLARTGPPAAGLLHPLRRMLERQAASTQEFSVDSFRQLMSGQTTPERFRAGLAFTLGLLALALAGIGVYGVASYSVSRETREIGIRMALGATPREVMRATLARSLKLAALGAALGLAGAWVALGLLRHFLFNVAPRDPLTLAAATLLLALIVFAASLAPARRAARLDPSQALREV